MRPGFARREDGGERQWRSFRLAAASAALGVLVAAAQPATAQSFLVRPGAVLSVPSLPPSAAEGAPQGEARGRQQALLDQTRRNPGDHDATYAYIDVSIRLGDNEAAIGALERLLNYDPKLVRANYTLGVLYYQMGSYDAAARYLRAAAASPAIEPGIQARIDALYPETLKQQSQSRWSGFLQAGLRYQSNPTFVPAGGTVRLNGQDLVVARGDRRRGDGSGFGLAQIGNDYDLQNQRGDVLETRFLGFGSGQFRASSFDFGYAEASFGPRFGLPELTAGASIKPYVVGQTSVLRNERAPYVSSGGGGLTTRLPVLPTLTLDLGVEARALSVRLRDPFAASTVAGGTSVSGYLVTTARLAPDIDLDLRAVGLRVEAARGGQSFAKGGAALAVGFQFDPPSELIARKWKVSPFIGGAVVDFDRANPGVDPTVRRRDTEFSTGLLVDAPLTATLGVSGLVSYERIGSNLPNYRQRGWTVLGGPTARF